MQMKVIYDTYEEALETGLQQALKLVVRLRKMKSSTLELSFKNSTMMSLTFISTASLQLK
jgi:hypothetical protein